MRGEFLKNLKTRSFFRVKIPNPEKENGRQIGKKFCESLKKENGNRN